MGHQLLLLYPDGHLDTRSLPCPIVAYCKYWRRLAALRVACAPPTHNPESVRLPASFPSLSVFRAQDSSRHHTKGLSLVYLPLDWKTPVPSPPIRKHLPIDAMAHLIIPLMSGLSRLPLDLHAPLPAGSNIPPPDLMRRTYVSLKPRARDLLAQEWDSMCPAPPYYTFQTSLSPHPFMGLDKFIAGRIHQMRADKSYLAAHPSWWSELPDDTFPRCGSAPESFEHAILHCPDKNRERNLLLVAVASVNRDSPLWSQTPLLQALGQFISATRTGFPPNMHPYTSPHPPSPPPRP